MQDFECDIDWTTGGCAVVSIRGELDMHTAPLLEAAFGQVRAKCAGGRLVVDLTECGFMDSTALGVLVTAQKDLVRAPLDVVAYVGLLRILTITGLSDVFRIHKTREAALQAVAERAARAEGGGTPQGSVE